MQICQMLVTQRVDVRMEEMQLLVERQGRVDESRILLELWKNSVPGNLYGCSIAMRSSAIDSYTRHQHTCGSRMASVSMVLKRR